MGKAKGNAFERRTAKRLSRWLTRGEDAKQLIRSKASGGWRSNVGEGAWRQIGDLAPNGPLGETFRRYFAVECKYRKDVDLWHFYTTQPGANIAGWWGKLLDEIEETDVDDPPAPLLVVRTHYRPTMVGVPAEFVRGRPLSLVHTFDPDNILPPIGLLPLDLFVEEDPETWYGEVRLWREGPL